MNWLCMIGLHKWRETRLLEQTLPSGIVVSLDGDACARCEKVRDPVNMADTYALMSNLPGRIRVPSPHDIGESQ